MALGDSITAGFLARSPAEHQQQSPPTEGQLRTQKILSRPIVANEYRGLAYPIGGDEGAVTIPNILSHWSRDLVGMSTGHHPLLACVGSFCTWKYDDGLNVALSGSTSDSLLSQVRGKLVAGFRKRWRLLKIGCFQPSRIDRLRTMLGSMSILESEPTILWVERAPIVHDEC